MTVGCRSPRQSHPMAWPAPLGGQLKACGRVQRDCWDHASHKPDSLTVPPWSTAVNVPIPETVTDAPAATV
jgi:hypothetical protein